MQTVGALALPALILFPGNEVPTRQAVDYVTSRISHVCVYQFRPLIPDFHRKLTLQIHNTARFKSIDKMLLFRLIRESVASAYLGAGAVLNPLPMSLGYLTDTELLRVFYLNSIDQQSAGWACGYRAVIAAAAVQSLVKLNTDSLSYPDFNALATGYANTHPGLTGCLAYIRPYFSSGHDAVEEGTLALEEHLAQLVQMPAFSLPPENVHIIGDYGRGMHIVESTPGIYFHPRDPILRNLYQDVDTMSRITEPCQLQSIIEQAIVQNFLQQYVRPNRSGAHYFICHTLEPSKHWIVIAAVKLRNKRPFLLVLDSDNSPIDGTGDTAKLIPFFYERFVQPFDHM